MKFSYNWLQSFFKKKLPQPEKLAEILTQYAFAVEEVKKEENDFILDIDVRPNRASDCFSHIGIAREISAVLNYNAIGSISSKACYKFQIPEYKLIEDKKNKAKDLVQVVVENKGGCPRYTARVINGVRVGYSPKWIRDRLKTCGLRPINNIVDITNYVMLETGQPLHAFDGKKLEGGKIIVRFAERGEVITTLDNEKYELDENILVIADAKKPLAIAGIKGGKSAEIDEQTKIVVVESANFNSKNIRFDSRVIDLKTDASLRFEHGIDFNLAEFAVNRVAALIQTIAGGEIAAGLIDISSKKVLPKKILLNLNYVEKLLNLKIPEKEIRDILERLNFKTKKQSLGKEKTKTLGQDSRFLEVEVPGGRLDVLIQEDLIEEIGRIYGYQKIPSVFPVASLVPPIKNFDIFWEDLVKDVLREVGLTEVYNYSFISEKDVKVFGYHNILELENPISSDFQYLRPSLIPSLLKNIERNQKAFSEINIFELGKIYRKNQDSKSKARSLSENKMLSMAMTGDKFYEAKGLIDALLNKLGISDIWYDEYRTKVQEKAITFWHPKKCAEIKIGQERIGFLGEISPRILNEYKITSKVIYFDIFFDELAKIASEEHEYRPISRFPSAVRDIAVLVPRFIKVEDVLNKIEEAGGGIIRDVDLFDIYEGEELPGGKKNLAFHIIYQAEDRTLSSKEIDNIQNKITQHLEKNSEWNVRK